MSQEKTPDRTKLWLGVAVLCLLGVLGWTFSLATALPAMEHGVRVMQLGLGLLILLVALHLWQLPRDASGSSGVVPLFTSRGSSVHRQTPAILVYTLGLCLGLGLLLSMVGALQTVDRQGPQAVMLNGKGKVLGSAIEQVTVRSRWFSVVVALLPLAIWAVWQQQARHRRRLLSRGDDQVQVLEATTTAGSNSLVHRFSRGQEASYSGHRIEISTGSSTLLLHTDGALFASTSRQVSEGSLLSQQLPSPARLLVAGRVEGDLVLNPRGGAIVIFACGKAHDPRWLLRAVQLRQGLLLLLWLAGLALVAFAYR